MRIIKIGYKNLESMSIDCSIIVQYQSMECGIFMTNPGGRAVVVVVGVGVVVVPCIYG